MDDGPNSPKPAAAATFQPLAADQWVFNRYWLARELGRGSGSAVWLAEDRRLQGWVALKFLARELAADPAALEAVRHETLLSRRIEHPCIARILDFEQDDTMAAIAMEFVEGSTLSQLREQRTEECFDAADLEHWMVQLCEALHYAHTGPRVVHGDLRPGNLMIGADGNLQVTDFGIARVVAEAASRTIPAPIASAALPYRSPQQALGAPPREADDIYAVGAVIYEMITSQPPFYRGDIAAQIQSAAAPSMVARREELQIYGVPIPPAWEEAVAACLAKHAEDRPASAGALADWLETGRRAGGSAERRTAVSARGSRSRALALLVAGAFLLGGVLVWNYEESHRRPALPPSAPAQSEPSPIPSLPAEPVPVRPASTPEPAPLTLAPPKTGFIFVNSLPAGATVFVDGEFKGQSPMKLENVPLRSCRLALEKEGYERAELMIDARAGGLRQPPLIELVRKPDVPPRATPPPVELPTSMPPVAAPPRATPPPPPSTPRPSATPLPVPPPATPSPAAESRPSTMADAEAAEAVASAYVQALMTANPAPYLELCAPRVDFFDEGVRNHESIRRNRQKLTERWPIYRVQNVRDVTVEDTGEPAMKRVAFTYEWEASNLVKKLDRSGTAHDVLDLHKIGGRWLITKMRQERVGR